MATDGFLRDISLFNMLVIANKHRLDERKNYSVRELETIKLEDEFEIDLIIYWTDDKCFGKKTFTDIHKTTEQRNADYIYAGFATIKCNSKYDDKLEIKIIDDEVHKVTNPGHWEITNKLKEIKDWYEWYTRYNNPSSKIQTYRFKKACFSVNKYGKPEIHALLNDNPSWYEPRCRFYSDKYKAEKRAYWEAKEKIWEKKAAERKRFKKQHPILAFLKSYGKVILFYSFLITFTIGVIMFLIFHPIILKVIGWGILIIAALIFILFENL